MLYVKKKKKGLNVSKVSKIDVEEYDSPYVEIKINNKKYILGVVYRLPKQTEENNMRLYNEIKSIIKDKNTVILGDFNNPSVNWSTLTGDREGRRLILRKTHFCGNRWKSLLGATNIILSIHERL